MKNSKIQNTKDSILSILECKKAGDNFLKTDVAIAPDYAIVSIETKVMNDTSNGLSFHTYQQKQIEGIFSGIGMKLTSTVSRVYEFEGVYTTTLSMHFKEN